MKVANQKMGLVLSGGGAKGAYEVGIIKALLEFGVKIDVISGASIGALNGAILACAPSIESGLKRMEKIWKELSYSPPIKGKPFSVYLTFLLAAGLPLSRVGQILSLYHGLKLSSSDFSIASIEPIKELIDEYIDISELAKGTPLFISVFPSRGASKNIIRCLLAELGIMDSPYSKFIHVQKLPYNQQKKALLASAAIPFLFNSVKVGNSLFADGGIGGWQKNQGNTPITPLLEYGCNRIIISHLDDGSLWSRYDFTDAIIYEIRPRRNISRNGVVKDILGFNERNINSWIEQGYDDTVYCIKRILKPIVSKVNLTASETLLDKTIKFQEKSNINMRLAMERVTSQ